MTDDDVNLRRVSERRPDPKPVGPSPIVMGDPWYGAPRCRICQDHFYSDQKPVRVKWWPRWRNAFVHEHCQTTQQPRNEE